MVHAQPLKIEDLQRELAEAQAALALLREPLAWVEITHSDDLVSVVPVAEYQRLSALDLRHTRLRMLTESEARARGLLEEG